MLRQTLLKYWTSATKDRLRVHVEGKAICATFTVKNAETKVL
ncbi:hypothetical protein [Vibrio chaetopteri]